MRGFKNFKGSDARCPSIHFLFYAHGIAVPEACALPPSFCERPEKQAKGGENEVGMHC